MKKIKAFVLIVLFVAVPLIAGHSVVLRFNNEVGRKYRIKNLITQDIFVNGTLYAREAGMNKALIESVSLSNNYGLFQGEYSYYARNLTVEESYHLEGVYQTKFYRSVTGAMIIEPRYYMPTLRNIPTFPDYDLKIGDSWTGTGSEMHEGLMEGFQPMEFQGERYVQTSRHHDQQPGPAAREDIHRLQRHALSSSRPEPFQFYGVFPRHLLFQ
jgi:hypothetical protein